MNRQQRRQAQRGQTLMVDLRTITWPWQLTTAECETQLSNRLIMNTQETGHPFHHRTASGVIVEPDPTLEYYLSRLTPEKQEHIRLAWMTRELPGNLGAMPVNRKFYGNDIYEGH